MHDDWYVISVNYPNDCYLEQKQWCLDNISSIDENWTMGIINLSDLVFMFKHDDDAVRFLLQFAHPPHNARTHKLP